MFCENCGKEILAGEKFCGNCGQKISEPSEGIQAAENRPLENNANAVQAEPVQTSKNNDRLESKRTEESILHLIGKSFLLLVVIGFFMPVSCGLKGSDIVSFGLENFSGWALLVMVLVAVSILLAVAGIVLAVVSHISLKNPPLCGFLANASDSSGKLGSWCMTAAFALMLFFIVTKLGPDYLELNDDMLFGEMNVIEFILHFLKMPFKILNRGFFLMVIGWAIANSSKAGKFLSEGKGKKSLRQQFNELKQSNAFSDFKNSEYVVKGKEQLKATTENLKEKGSEYAEKAAEKAKAYTEKGKEQLKTQMQSASKMIESKKGFFTSKKFIIGLASVAGGIVFICAVCFGIVPVVKNKLLAPKAENIEKNEEPASIAEKQTVPKTKSEQSAPAKKAAKNKDSFTEQIMNNCIGDGAARYYILGFTPDSKIAFIEQSFIGGDAFVMEHGLVVQDLISDKRIFEERVGAEYDDIEKIIKESKNLIKKIISKYKVDFRPIELQQFPYKDENSTIDVKLKFSDGGKNLLSDDWGWHIIKYSCIAKNQAGKAKTIDSGTFASGSRYDKAPSFNAFLKNPKNIKIHGYLKNPFENRLVVALEIDDDESYLESLKLIGCHTKAGF